LVHTLTQGGQLVRARYSPAGRWILTTTALLKAQIWDAASGQPVGPSFAHFDSYRLNRGGLYVLSLVTNGVVTGTSVDPQRRDVKAGAGKALESVREVTPIAELCSALGDFALYDFASPEETRLIVLPLDAASGLCYH